jgi:hypothetical protein
MQVTARIAAKRSAVDSAPKAGTQDSSNATGPLLGIVSNAFATRLQLADRFGCW